MNINNIINQLDINIDINCDYLKLMAFIINSSINFDNLIKENLDDIEIKILKSKSHRGQWKAFTELSNYEMRYSLTRLNETEMGSLILFMPKELTFKSIIFIKDNNIYEYKRNDNGKYELIILSNDIYLQNLLKLDLIDLKSYRDIVLENFQ